MSNESIALIIGFGIGAFIVAIFAIIIIILLLKRRPTNDSDEELFTKYCMGDVINTKRMMESANPKPKDCKIIRPRKLCSPGYEINTFSKTLGEDLAKYLFGIETIYKASLKTTESIIEYIDTVKRFVRSEQFTSLATPEKQYVATRIEEQLCTIIFKYIVNSSNRLYEGDEAIIFKAIGLKGLMLLSDL
jgi:hypothetical protein